MLLKGNAASEGAVIGPARCYCPRTYAAQACCRPAPAQKQEELRRWQAAAADAAQELETRIAHFRTRRETEKADIFAAHLELLQDEAITEEIEDAIRGDGASAEWAVQQVYDVFIRQLSRAADALIAARAADLADLRGRLLRILAGDPAQELSALAAPVVLVAHDLLPSDTASLEPGSVLAIVTETGGANSHSAILARSMGIPAVLGAAGALAQIADGTELFVDGGTGEVCAVTAENRARLCAAAAAYRQKKAGADAFLAHESRMLDGTPFSLGLNIGGTEAVPEWEHADFVGLFRTEFLYMQSTHFPTEEEQFAAYRTVLQRGKPVTLRTLDIGGDKTLPYYALPQEQNPFLGRRALRLCLAEPEIFRTQLRAALRASACGKLRLMFPMVGGLEDLAQARAALAQAQAELTAEGVPFDADMPVGAMIEIPALALMADELAAQVDFASIGTNDLCQYLCAADRMNPEVSRYYQSESPALLRLLRDVIGAFCRAGKPICVCGETAGDPRFSAVLAGFGLTHFSMSASRLAGVKSVLCTVDTAHARALAQKACALSAAAEVRALLDAQ